MNLTRSSKNERLSQKCNARPTNEFTAITGLDCLWHPSVACLLADDQASGAEVVIPDVQDWSPDALISRYFGDAVLRLSSPLALRHDSLCAQSAPSLVSARLQR